MQFRLSTTLPVPPFSLSLPPLPFFPFPSFISLILLTSFPHHPSPSLPPFLSFLLYLSLSRCASLSLLPHPAMPSIASVRNPPGSLRTPCMVIHTIGRSRHARALPPSLFMCSCSFYVKAKISVHHLWGFATSLCYRILPTNVFETQPVVFSMLGLICHSTSYI